MPSQVKFSFAAGPDWGTSKVFQSGASSSLNLPAYVNLTKGSFVINRGSYLLFTIDINQTQTFGSASLTAGMDALGTVKFDDGDTVYTISKMITQNHGSSVDVHCLVFATSFEG